MNLAQKHRQYKFKDILGHDKVSNELLKRSKDRNFPQVILFQGNPGVGKTSFSYVIAMAANCKDLKDGEPCGQCDNCLDIKNQRFTRGNIREYDARDIKVDQIEEIKEFISSPPMLDNYNILFIDELQGMFGQGASASAREKLLKVIEKINNHTIIIFGTMDSSVLSSAYKRRMVTYNLKDVAYDQIAIYLMDVLAQENISLDGKEDAIGTIVESSNGSPGLAISYLERCVYGEIWSKEEILQEFDLASNDTIIDYTAKCLKGDISLLNQYVSGEVVNGIEETLMVLYKQLKGASLKKEEQKKVGSLSKHFGEERVKKVFELVIEAKQYGYFTPAMITLLLIRIIDSMPKETTGSNGRRVIRG